MRINGDAHHVINLLFGVINYVYYNGILPRERRYRKGHGGT